MVNFALGLEFIVSHHRTKRAFYAFGRGMRTAAVNTAIGTTVLGSVFIAGGLISNVLEEHHYKTIVAAREKDLGRKLTAKELWKMGEEMKREREEYDRMFATKPW